MPHLVAKRVPPAVDASTNRRTVRLDNDDRPETFGQRRSARATQVGADRTAVTCGDEQFTYLQTWDRCDRVAIIGPNAGLFYTEPLPKSGAGKVLKRELRAPYWEGAEVQVGAT